MSKAIITLTTDFGLTDHFVGTMKGVILGICPGAQIVDISHDIQAFEVTEAAFLIAQAYPYFPRRTVHVIVVDPGVGTSRRPILVEAAGQYFIAPDNGVLSIIFAQEKHKAREITVDRYFRRPVSQTFHGRDIFAPVAAHIAGGLLPSNVGKRINNYLRPNFQSPVRTGKHSWSGAVLKIDRFGNVITNFRPADFPQLDRRQFELTIGPWSVGSLVRNYAEGGIGELFLIVGSSGYFEISSNQASAAKIMGCAAGAPVELTVG